MVEVCLADNGFQLSYTACSALFY
uniref:Uncharacterized protein n=1 Tax=Anguilla anguilla TaxID=7936 RepID=A0A0E9W150_ANGAN